MIKFFRKIRQKLITEGRFSKYVLYALGEILLVVIGILIALQINNRNIYSKERAKERAYLSELRYDLVSDTTSLNIVLENTRMHINHATEVLKFIETETIKDTIGLLENIQRAGYLVFFNPNLSTYNDLISSGNITLIRDNELKRRLDSYVSYLQQITERYEISKRKVWLKYSEYYQDEYIDGRLREFSMLDSTDIRQYPVDWKRMAKDSILKQKLSWVIGNAQSELRWHSDTKKGVISLIDYLDSMIEK